MDDTKNWLELVFKMDIEEKMLYICTKDGEIIDTLSSRENYAKLEDGDRVLRRKSIESFEKSVEIKMRFAKVNFLVFGDICRKYSIFPYLVQYVGYMSGKLVFRNGKDITRNNLPKICKVSVATVNRQLSGLISDDIIKPVKQDGKTIYFMNPYIVHLGKKINLSTYEMFKNTIYKNSYEGML